MKFQKTIFQKMDCYDITLRVREFVKTKSRLHGRLYERVRKGEGMRRAVAHSEFSRAPWQREKKYRERWDKLERLVGALP